MSTESYWRKVAKPVIEKVVAAAPKDIDEKDLRKLIGKAYPFGDKNHHPYKIWLSEIKSQMDKKYRPQPPKEKSGKAFTPDTETLILEGMPL